MPNKVNPVYMSMDSLQRALTEDLLDPNLPISQIEDCLREAGLNPTNLRLAGAQLAGELIDRHRLAWQEDARQTIKKRAPIIARLKSLASESREQIMLRFAQLRSEGHVVAAFRNRQAEQTSLDELRAILEEVELLRELESGDK